MDEGRERVTEPRVDVGGRACPEQVVDELVGDMFDGRARLLRPSRREPPLDGAASNSVQRRINGDQPDGESALGVRMPNCARLKRLSLNTVRTSHWRATAMAAVPFGNSTSRVGCPRKRSTYSGGSDVPGLGSRGNRMSVTAVSIGAGGKYERCRNGRRFLYRRRRLLRSSHRKLPLWSEPQACGRLSRCGRACCHARRPVPRR